MLLFWLDTNSLGFGGLPFGLRVLSLGCCVFLLSAGIGLLVLVLPPRRFVFSPPVSSLTFCCLIPVPPEAPLSAGISGFVLGSPPLLLDLGGSSAGLGFKLLDDAGNCGRYGKS